MLISKIRKQTTYVIYFFAFIFFISIFYMYGVNITGGDATKDRTSEKGPTSVVLTVDGTKIPREAFNERYLSLLQQYEAAGYGDQVRSYAGQMAIQAMTSESMINQTIYLQEAKKRGIKVSNAEVTKKVREIQSSYVGAEAKSADPSIQGRFKALMTAKDKEAEFKKILFNRGTSYETFLKAVRDDLTQEKVGKEIAKSGTKKEAAEAQKKAADIKAKLAAGESFENLAKQFSEDEGSKENGGIVSWASRGSLDSAYASAAFKLKPNEISDPVRSQYGFHIIQLLAKRVAGDKDFDAAKPAIIESIRQRKSDQNSKVTDEEIKNEYEQVFTRHILIKVKPDSQVMQEWIQKQRSSKKHKIEYIDPELKAYHYQNIKMFDPAAKDPNNEDTIKLYKAAIKKNPNNLYLHAQVGAIYYKMYNEKTQKAASTDPSDPYAKAMSQPGATPAPAAAPKDKKQAAKDRELLRKSLAAYKEAITISAAKYQYDPAVMIPAAQVAEQLGNKALALEYYANTVDFAAGNIQYLAQLKTGLTPYAKQKSAKKALKEIDELIGEYNAAEAEKAAKEGTLGATPAQQAAAQAAAQAARQDAAQTQQDTQQKQPANAQPQKSNPQQMPGKVIGGGKVTIKPAVAKPIPASSPTSSAKPVSKPAAKPVVPAPKQPVTPAPTATPAPTQQQEAPAPAIP